jgi:hypothetical protein
VAEIGAGRDHPAGSFPFAIPHVIVTSSAATSTPPRGADRDFSPPPLDVDNFVK